MRQQRINNTHKKCKRFQSEICVGRHMGQNDRGAAFLEKKKKKYEERKKKSGDSLYHSSNSITWNIRVSDDLAFPRDWSHRTTLQKSPHREIHIFAASHTDLN